VRVLREMAPGELPIDAALLHRKLQADRAKLETVLQFAWSPGCRKERLLRYFGDARRSFQCGACDRCETSALRTRPLSAEEGAIARAVLALVARIDGRLGRVKLAQLLVGKGGEVAERLGLAEDPSVGALRQLGQNSALDWIDTLLGGGFLEKEDLSGHEGAYVLRLSRLGRKSLRDGEGMLAAPPAARPGPAPRRARGREAAPAPPPPATEGAAPAPGLLDALKAWRRDAAKQRAVPAYVVFHDATLRAIAESRPRSLEELGQVPGVGAYKIEEYGETLLELLRSRG
jgi:ATP-dependent DNA helicase RecQ